MITKPCKGWQSRPGAEKGVLWTARLLPGQRIHLSSLAICTYGLSCWCSILKQIRLEGDTIQDGGKLVEL